MKTLLFYLAIFFTTVIIVSGQDLRGSEIKFYPTGMDSYTFEIYLYAQTSIGIDRHTVVLANDTLNGIPTLLPNDITEWKYTYVYTFSGNGYYQIAFADSFRIANIQNISNSSTEYIYPQVIVVINPYAGENSSPLFQSKQTEVLLIGNTLIHEPNAVDPDGDSLVFSLVPASSANYMPPAGVTIDAITGKVEMPFTLNINAINIKVDEFRSGMYIGTTYREMLMDGNALSSVHEIKERQILYKLFPNPSEKMLNIKFLKNITSSDIKIFDNLGRKVYSIFNKCMDIEIDISNFQDGNYFLEVNVDGCISRQQFVKE